MKRFLALIAFAGLTSGTCFYRITAGDRSDVREMVLMK